MSKTIKTSQGDAPADALLAALYNRTRPRGMGLLHSLGRPMTRKDARAILEAQGWVFRFDYVLGRPIKLVEKDGYIDRVDLYERDTYPGAFDDAVLDALTTPEAP